jgi:D-3-phosphoglycerate dehydrogenase
MGRRIIPEVPMTTDEPVEALILDLLDWLDAGPRPYVEVMDAWRTSCPRLPVWEEANRRGFLDRRPSGTTHAVVAISPAGRTHLRRHRSVAAV